MAAEKIQSRTMRGGKKYESRLGRQRRKLAWRLLGQPNSRQGITPVLRNYYVQTEKVKNPLRVVHLSDLHGCIYGKNQSVLLQMVERLSPDVVVMTGDMLEIRFDKEPVGVLLKALAEKYPCFCVTGNHEMMYRNYETAKRYIRFCGVRLLEGRCETINLCKEVINLCGVDDPKCPDRDFVTELERAFEGIQKKYFTILLTHRPEKVPLYRRYPCDLVLSGHAHGGQWRIPGLMNGFFVPNQGFFPKYAGGRYDFKGQTHIVSRGLAYHVRIPRIFNPPEVVVIDIVPKVM